MKKSLLIASMMVVALAACGIAPDSTHTERTAERVRELWQRRGWVHALLFGSALGLFVIMLPVVLGGTAGVSFGAGTLRGDLAVLVAAMAWSVPATPTTRGRESRSTWSSRPSWDSSTTPS